MSIWHHFKFEEIYHTQVSQLFHSFLTMQIYSVVKQKNPFRAYSHTVHQLCGPSLNLHLKKVAVPLCTRNCWRNDYSSVPVLFHNSATTIVSKVVGRNGYNWSNHRPKQRERLRMRAALDVAAAVDVINDLGLDTLTFLAVTVVVVPLFRRIKASPVRMTFSFFFSTYFLLFNSDLLKLSYLCWSMWI